MLSRRSVNKEKANDLVIQTLTLALSYDKHCDSSWRQLLKMFKYSKYNLGDIRWICKNQNSDIQVGMQNRGPTRTSESCEGRKCASRGDRDAATKSIDDECSAQPLWRTSESATQKAAYRIEFAHFHSVQSTTKHDKHLCRGMCSMSDSWNTSDD